MSALCPPTPSPPPALTGTRLRELRIYNNLTRSQLALRLGVTKDAVAKWEKSQRAISPAMELLVRTLFPASF